MFLSTLLPNFQFFFRFNAGEGLGGYFATPLPTWKLDTKKVVK